VSGPAIPPELYLAPGVGFLALTTPDEWLAQVKDAGDAVVRAVDDAVARASARIEEMDDHALAGLGLISPVGGLIGGIIDHQAGQAKEELRRKLDEAARTLADELTRLWEAIDRETTQLVGDPAGLVRTAGDLFTAKAALDGCHQEAAVDMRDLDRYWGGLGAAAFTGAVVEQLEAMEGVAASLDGAARLLGDAAEALKQTWSDILSALLGLAANIVGVLASAFDAGNVLTFEVGPAVALIGVAITFLSDCTEAVRRLHVVAVTSGVIEWSSVGGSNHGLVGGTDWPPVDAQDAHDYSGAGRWSL
jgi:uncharacterized protein YukE